MRCPRCGLPDPYHGDGDGIGSCDCMRCECCSAGPDDCACRRDFDQLYDNPDEPFDLWCNDTECCYRTTRLHNKAQAIRDEAAMKRLADA